MSKDRVKDILMNGIGGIPIDGMEKVIAEHVMTSPIETLEMLLQHYPRSEEFSLVEALEVCYYNRMTDKKDYILNQMKDIERQGIHGFTALHVAAKGGDVNVVMELLEKGAEIDAKDEERKTPFRRATEAGFIPMMVLLLEKGADLNTKDKVDTTPLHAAVIRPHIGVIQFLLERGADPNSPDAGGDSPMFFAMYKPLEILKLFAQYGGKLDATNHKGWNILHRIAALRPDDSMGKAKYLLEQQVDLNLRTTNTNDTPLEFAIYSPVRAESHLGLIELFLKNKVDKRIFVGVLPWTLSDCLTEYAYVEVLRMFSNYGLDFKEETPLGFTCIYLAYINNDKANFKYLLIINVPLYGSSNYYYFNRRAFPRDTGHILIITLAKRTVRGDFVSEQDIEYLRSKHPEEYRMYKSCVKS